MAIKYYEKTPQELEKLAKQGDIEAAYFVGMVYRQQGDTDKAMYYLNICYEAKHPKGTFQLGLIHYLRGEYEDAILLFEGAITFGDKHAYFYLAKCYENGYGVPKSITNAYNYYTFAIAAGNKEAEEARNKLVLPENNKEEIDYEDLYQDELEILLSNGDYKACFQLGKIYEKDGDFKKAFETYKKGMDEIQDVRCINKIGLFYFKGTYVDLDMKTAFSYFSIAARNNYLSSMYNLAFCFEEGNGVEQNIYMAMDWYKRAAEMGDEDAKEKYIALAKSYSEEERPDPTEDKKSYTTINGINIMNSIDPLENELKEKALKGDFIACRDLITLYIKNKEFEKSYKFSKHMYDTTKIDIYAFFIGIHFYHGHYVDKDHDKAYKLILRASADQSKYRYGGPAFYLGRFYQNGFVVKPSPHLAFSFFKRAANYQFIGSYYYLGKCYEDGYGTDKDMDKAIEWYKKAADENVSDAISRLKALGLL